MASLAPNRTFQQVFDRCFSEFKEQLETTLETEIAARVLAATETSAAESRQTARHELAEQLNQGARRLGQSREPEETSSVLVDLTAPFCEAAAVFRIGQNVAHGVAARGLDDGRLRTLEVPLSQAAAFRQAFETKDTVIAVSTAGELSDSMLELFGGQTIEGKVHVFPIVVRANTVALLCAWSLVEVPALELLTQMASATLEIQALAAGRTPLADSTVRQWSDLSADEQQVHLVAQRFARVRVSAMRLYHDAAVKRGRATGDLYGALRGSIDTARKSFFEKFVATSPCMVDYLHLELVRSLANENAALLGPHYPGPLV